ncbi:hypothetical protein K470DRAFT_111883 [Piedraia hortae CBS 480.64]|uniref:Uncharacterized protein n=1 Tax=Piedraia hortae CBS 480.64 TaxID=1314780 RepID=A0A6A7BW57_9PEZI|nr:hypothetical protein K470DRAFT_111883 [Piedraia hortae CBS 480.64]
MYSISSPVMSCMEVNDKPLSQQRQLTSLLSTTPRLLPQPVSKLDVPEIDMSDKVEGKRRVRTSATVSNGRYLTIKLPPGLLRKVHDESVHRTIAQSNDQSNHNNEIEHGRNHHGTFSKEHTLRFPNITWVHRGKGRWLPVDEVATNPNGSFSKRGRSAPESHNERRGMWEQLDIPTGQARELLLGRQARPRPDLPGFYNTSSDSEDSSEMYKVSEDEADQSFHNKAEGVPERWLANAQLSGPVPQGNNSRDHLPTGALVDKTYKDMHPEIEWVHRGKGRYVRKSDLLSQSSSLATPGKSRKRRASRSIEEGSPSLSIHDDSQRLESTEQKQKYDLVDKAYVLAHPEEKWYHRGQGKYARGSRPGAAVTVRSQSQASQEKSQATPLQLFSSAYVNAHPHLNFYHKGQGRWALGTPPPGSHNKIARRGPAANDCKTDDSQARASSIPSLQVMTGTDEPSPLTALFLKADGPDKWPQLPWIYRGGGKWSQTTKAQADDIKKQSQLQNTAGVTSPEDTVNNEETQPRGRRRQRTPVRNQEAPKPMLAPHEDILTEKDLPPVFRSEWRCHENEGDDLDRQLRQNFSCLNTDQIVRSLLKHDPKTRPLSNLKLLSSNAAKALQVLQTEYQALDRITAPHAKIPRRTMRPPNLPIDPQIFEDKKEADLYGYTFDPRRIGHQDPDAQNIPRYATRELRKRPSRTQQSVEQSGRKRMRLASPTYQRMPKRVAQLAEGISAPGSVITITSGSPTPLQSRVASPEGKGRKG